MAGKEHITQRQSCVLTSRQLLRYTYNPKHPKRRKNTKKAERKLKTIAGRLIRELERELASDRLAVYQAELDLFQQVLTQKRSDKNKIYSLHKPFTSCIAKGKAHKSYEFGNKIGLITTSKSLIITAIKSFQENPHDSKTIRTFTESTIEPVTGPSKQIFE